MSQTRWKFSKALHSIATVGRGMIHNIGVAARLFGALAKSGVNIRMIDQGSSEINIIVGIDESDFETGIRAYLQRVLRLKTQI